MKLSALILVLLAGNALAWDNPYEYKPRTPRTTNSYDPATGNMTNTYRHADGSSDTYGINANTGSIGRYTLAAENATGSASAWDVLPREDDGADNKGCGLPGSTVTVAVEGQQLVPLPWDNRTIQEVVLR